MTESGPTVYASPKIAAQVAQSFGNRTSTKKVSMRSSRDVNKFIKKVESAHKRAATSKQKFD